MPIRHENPFRDPTNLSNPDANPFVKIMRDSADEGTLPILFGEALRNKPGAWLEGSEKSELIVEIGCHKGDVLCQFAKARPEAFYVGLDITFKRVVETARRIRNLSLDNVMSVLANAQGIHEVFNPGEVQGLVVFYPDPWNQKKRQLKNRLINDSFAAKAFSVLAPGGFFWLKTDDRGYFEQAGAALEKAKFTPSKPDVHGLTLEPFTSRFEAGFALKNVPKNEAIWIKPIDS